MVEFAQSVPNLLEASTNLYDTIKGGNLVAYPDADMRLAVSRAVALETSRGWRIAKEKQSHKIDVIVALAQACLGAVKGQANGFENLAQFHKEQVAAITGRGVRLCAACDRPIPENTPYVRTPLSRFVADNGPERAMHEECHRRAMAGAA